MSIHVFTLLMGILLGWHIHNFASWVVDTLMPTRITVSNDEGDVIEEHTPEHHFPLIVTKHCPNGLSAKQILGYREIGGQYHPPVFPGTLDDWKEVTRNV